MNNIKKAAIRLIANAYLYGKEKDKQVSAYRFDSSFLTKRNITTVGSMNQLQEELNKLGWCFNILTFNDFVIQEKSFLAEVTRLSFGRLKKKSEDEINEAFIKAQHEKICNQMLNFLRTNSGFKCFFMQTDDMYKFNKMIAVETPTKTFKVKLVTYLSVNGEDISVKITMEEYRGDTVCDFKIPVPSYSVIKENGNTIINLICGKMECDKYLEGMEGK